MARQQSRATRQDAHRDGECLRGCGRSIVRHRTTAPRGARLFLKYKDPIVFGKDAYQPEEYPYYWRVFETNDDYFDYYRGYHAFRKLYGIDLPDEVLKKVYYKNALMINPRLPQAGWPR
jgi:uncharacterized protein